ncbi:uncharacterized protein LOC143011421 isoform X2 [Genypterus blacodes]|uniref:uncharacterized protein LOC143011421 isoform X2 n=1 Tax=Genypterus blacodes TaxID=154954 RepID=UPI003F75B714
MADSPLNFSAERLWTEEKERALIAFFSKHSCLWNHKSESYKNRHLRFQTLEQLRILLSAQPPSVPFTATSSSSLSSCTSSNIMVKCYWTDERERTVIYFYSEHGCLWNKKSENHNNRQLRLRLLHTLRAQLSHQSPVAFTVEDIKSKFKNLRTVFNREYKAVQASRAADKLYVSKWKHYHQLLFLCEACKEDDEPNEVQTLMPQQEEEEDEVGYGAPPVTSSSFTCCFTQTVKPEFHTTTPSSSSQIDTKDNTSAPNEIFLTSSPDIHKLSNQVSLLASSSETKPSAGDPGSSPQKVSASSPAQPDSRLSADFRCLWTEAKVQELISFYSEHSFLWNHKSDRYRNRLLRRTMLETLSSQLSAHAPVPFTVEDIKTKFRNLRTIFKREHKVVSSNKTCGSEDFYLPKWKHYRELMFLCDSCDEDAEAEKVHLHQPLEDGLLRLGSQALPPLLSYHTTSSSTTTHESQSATDPNIEAPLSLTPLDSQHSTPCSSISSSPASRGASGRKRVSCSPTASELPDFTGTLCSQPAVSPHTGFLKYVEECLNETPPDKVKKLKKRIIETIHSMSDDF